MGNKSHRDNTHRHHSDIPTVEEFDAVFMGSGAELPDPETIEAMRIRLENCDELKEFLPKKKIDAGISDAVYRATHAYQQPREEVVSREEYTDYFAKGEYCAPNKDIINTIDKKEDNIMNENYEEFEEFEDEKEPVKEGPVQFNEKTPWYKSTGVTIARFAVGAAASIAIGIVGRRVFKNLISPHISCNLTKSKVVNKTLNALVATGAGAATAYVAHKTSEFISGKEHSGETELREITFADRHVIKGIITAKSFIAAASVSAFVGSLGGFALKHAGFTTPFGFWFGVMGIVLAGVAFAYKIRCYEEQDARETLDTIQYAMNLIQGTEVLA